MSPKLRKVLSLALTISLLFQQIGFAQIAIELNIAGHLSRMSSSLAVEKFRPLHLRYFSYDSLNDNFKVLVDKGDSEKGTVPEKKLQSETQTLLNYFLVGVTLPDDMFWVNLRPDSESQIIDQYLEKTDVGRIMLAADLQLKKDTANLTSPATPEGKEYWDRLYKKAAELYGYDNVTIPTLTRPWIVPGEIIVRESQDSAYVYKATLKVMLEQDYLKDSATYNFQDTRSKALNEYSSELIKELIIPKLTKEVNSSKRYASLRQVYYSLILSRWFKQKFQGMSPSLGSARDQKGTVPSFASLINDKDLTNLISKDSWSKTDYFKQYQKSFAEGEYNIKEPVYTPTGQTIRSYFSGGLDLKGTAGSPLNNRSGLVNNVAQFSNDRLSKLGHVMEGNSKGIIKWTAASPITASSLSKKAISLMNTGIVDGKKIEVGGAMVSALIYATEVLANRVKTQEITLDDIEKLLQEEGKRFDPTAKHFLIQAYNELAGNTTAASPISLEETVESLNNLSTGKLLKITIGDEALSSLRRASPLGNEIGIDYYSEPVFSDGVNKVRHNLIVYNHVEPRRLLQAAADFVKNHPSIRDNDKIQKEISSIADRLGVNLVNSRSGKSVVVPFRPRSTRGPSIVGGPGSSAASPLASLDIENSLKRALGKFYVNYDKLAIQIYQKILRVIFSQSKKEFSFDLYSKYIYNKEYPFLRVTALKQEDGTIQGESKELRSRSADSAAVKVDIDNISASSPLSIKEEIESYTTKLEKARFEQNLRSLYGISYPEAFRINPDWAGIGFDQGDKKEQNRLGWSVTNLKWILENGNTVKNILKDAEYIRQNYKYVIFCGMGGSGLSVQVVKDTFGEKETKIYSLRTTDPQAIKDILDNEIAVLEGSLSAGLSKTLIIPVSKSGTTQETVSHKQYFEELFKGFGIDIKKHMWVVTDKTSPMDTGDYTQREIQLNGKGDIGGRFTAPTTNVFLLPLAIVAPERVEDILSLAKMMNDTYKTDDFTRLAAYLYYMAEHLGKDKVTMIMPDELKSLPMWAEQLFEESLGKERKGVSLFYGEKISPEVLKPVEQNDRVFLRINLNGKPTQEKLWDYLVKNDYPVFELNIRYLDSIGGIMLGLQRTVAAIAYLWGICFVDQPAVEGYKKETKKVYTPGKKVEVPSGWGYVSFNTFKLYYASLIEAGLISRRTLEDTVKKLDGNMHDAASVYAAIISILKAGPNFQAAEITSYGRMTPGLREVLDNARYEIFTKDLKMPSKLGEGPDKNHSYHQNIDAGRNMWFSTYFMANEIGQPAAKRFDENLLKAQAIGTAQSLINSKRPVVLIAFDGTAGASEKDVKDFFSRVSNILNNSSPVQLTDRPQASIIADFVKQLASEVERFLRVYKVDIVLKNKSGEYDFYYVSNGRIVDDNIREAYRSLSELKSFNALTLLEGKEVKFTAKMTPTEVRAILNKITSSSALRSTRASDGTIYVFPDKFKGVAFGTSGHRGKRGEQVDKGVAAAITQGVCDFINHSDEFKGKKKILILGSDPRPNNKAYQEEEARVALANGFKVYAFEDVMPTPIASFVIRFADRIMQLGRDEVVVGGINNTPSHNPQSDDGIKFNPGGKLQGSPSGSDVNKFVQDRANEVIEEGTGIKRLADNEPLASNPNYIKADPEKVVSVYIDRASKMVNIDLIRSAVKEKGLRWPFSTQNGAAGWWSRKVFNAIDKNLLILLGEEPLPDFGGLPKGPNTERWEQLKPLLDTIVSEKAPGGGATDGDGDRFFFADEKGEPINFNLVGALLQNYIVKVKGIKGSLKTCVDASDMFEKISKVEKREPIGFKAFQDDLRDPSKPISIAFEGGSGGLTLGRAMDSEGIGHILDKDGIIAQLIFLEMVADAILKGKTVSGLINDLYKEYGFYAIAKTASLKIDSDDLTVVEKVKKRAMDKLGAMYPVGSEFAGYKVTAIDNTDGVKLFLKDDKTGGIYWTLLRPSGTGSELRAYSEAVSLVSLQEAEKIKDELVVKRDAEVNKVIQNTITEVSSSPVKVEKTVGVTSDEEDLTYLASPLEELLKDLGSELQAQGLSFEFMRDLIILLAKNDRWNADGGWHNIKKSFKIGNVVFKEVEVREKISGPEKSYEIRMNGLHYGIPVEMIISVSNEKVTPRKEKGAAEEILSEPQAGGIIMNVLQEAKGELENKKSASSVVQVRSRNLPSLAEDDLRKAYIEILPFILNRDEVPEQTGNAIKTMLKTLKNRDFRGIVVKTSKNERVNIDWQLQATSVDRDGAVETIREVLKNYPSGEKFVFLWVSTINYSVLGIAPRKENTQTFKTFLLHSLNNVDSNESLASSPVKNEWFAEQLMEHVSLNLELGFTAREAIESIVDTNPTILGELGKFSYSNSNGALSALEKYLSSTKITNSGSGRYRIVMSGASSAVGKDVGGIDFRSLPMTIQPMGSFKGLNFKLPQLTPAQLAKMNIDSELQQIQNMVNSGILPSGERIKELIAACNQKKEISARADNLLLCLINICKLAEENAYETSPELREALVIVDSVS